MNTCMISCGLSRLQCRMVFTRGLENGTQMSLDYIQKSLLSFFLFFFFSFLSNSFQYVKSEFSPGFSFMCFFMKGVHLGENAVCICLVLWTRVLYLVEWLLEMNRGCPALLQDSSLLCGKEEIGAWEGQMLWIDMDPAVSSYWLLRRCCASAEADVRCDT